MSGAATDLSHAPQDFIVRRISDLHSSRPTRSSRKTLSSAPPSKPVASRRPACRRSRWPYCSIRTSIDLSALANSTEMPPPSQSTPQPRCSLSADSSDAVGWPQLAAAFEIALAVAELTPSLERVVQLLVLGHEFGRDQQLHGIDFLLAVLAQMRRIVAARKAGVGLALRRRHRRQTSAWRRPTYRARRRLPSRPRRREDQKRQRKDVRIARSPICPAIVCPRMARKRPSYTILVGLRGSRFKPDANAAGDAVP